MTSQTEKKLYAVLLGGRAPGCHIEVHDVVFVVDDSLEQAYPKLVSKWFGSTTGLHIDSSIELNIIDGHKIQLSTDPNGQPNQPALFFTNFGGYAKGFFGELHEVGFFVGRKKLDIIERAKNDLCKDSHLQHCDDNLMIGGSDTPKKIDDIIKVGCVDGYYLHLTPCETQPPLPILSTYRRLDVPEIIEQYTANFS